VFLQAACERLSALGGDPARQVVGVEIAPVAHAEALRALRAQCGSRVPRLLCSDFFDVAPGSLSADVVVGNPPFIRYQRFSGGQRRRALRQAATQGVSLSALSSSWAPFLVHATSMVKPGGRLAMVVPFEMTHASYARPVLEFLAGCFGRVTLLTFKEKLFAHLNEDTLLLLADQKGGKPTRFLWRELANAGRLLGLLSPRLRDGVPGTRALDHEALCQGKRRFVEYLLPTAVRHLYRELAAHPDVGRLGDVASAGIGYVTGANAFFHLRPVEARALGIPEVFLKPAVRRGKALSGLRFTKSDWRAGLQSGQTGCLLSLQNHRRLPLAVRKYVERGERLGIPSAYKCRSRSPWYCVPHVYSPDGFLTYMSGASPRLVANAARAVATNTLHVVRIHSLCPLDALGLAALWSTSLTRLSVEIEGHALGGGMLKLEPREAASALLPVKHWSAMSALGDHLDHVCRTHGPSEAQRVADEEILLKRLGLSARECRLLKRGRDILFNRRYRTRNGKGHGG